MPLTYTLTDSRLIDLDSLDASLLEINDFVTKSESKLSRLRLLGDVGTREGPVENSDRTSEHALHWLLGQTLSVAAPLHRHRPRTADIRDDDGGTDITSNRD